jgi:hypothetical protein
MSDKYPKAEYVDQILGKTITGIVIKEFPDTPRMQIHLAFSDGTNFEFYCTNDTIMPIKGLRRGGLESISRYDTENIVYQASCT